MRPFVVMPDVQWLKPIYVDEEEMADKEEVEKTIAEDLVVTKYKMAGDIVNRVLKQVIDRCISGTSVREICEYGDQLLSEETGQVFKKEKDLKKGIAFPTCISVNHCICHFSPVPSELDYTLKDDDLVKIFTVGVITPQVQCSILNTGRHPIAFETMEEIRVRALARKWMDSSLLWPTRIVLGSSAEHKVTGRKADVTLAAHYASQAALRLLKPGNETYAVTEAVQKVCDQFKCKPIEGMLSHQLKQFKIDGEKTIIQNPNDAQKKEHEKFEFEVHDVYAMDVLVSSGEGV
ncbi:unnamed protein product, partial [Timema podura]|nr:unnamed protein product [Timema podura]